MEYYLPLKTFTFHFRKRIFAEERVSYKITNIDMFARMLSCVWLFGTPQTVACQVLLFMGFPRQEYWGQLPFPSPGDLPDLEPMSPALASEFYTTEPSVSPNIDNKLAKNKILSSSFSSLLSSLSPHSHFCNLMVLCFMKIFLVLSVLRKG